MWFAFFATRTPCWLTLSLLSTGTHTPFPPKLLYSQSPTSLYQFLSYSSEVQNVTFPMVEPEKFPVNAFLLTYKVPLNRKSFVGLVWSSSLILSINFLRMHWVLSFWTLIKTKTSAGLSIIPPPEYYWKLPTAWPLYPWLQPFQFGNLAIIFCSPNCPPIKVVFHQFGIRIFWECVLKALLHLR